MSDDISVHRERVVRDVIARINAAPKIERNSGILADISAWSVPAIAAAALVIVASSAITLAHDRRAHDPSTIAEQLGVPAQISRSSAPLEIGR
jgi:hypothetical protein